ncbi:MAG: hypothetical protein V4534_06905 [Myxococcota bacterium]
MPKLMELIGTVVKTSEQVLHQDFIERFAKASLDFDTQTLRYAALSGLGDYEGALHALHLTPKNILHTRETISIFNEPVLEQTMTIETLIKDLYEQQAGEKPIAFVVINVAGSQGSKEIFLTERIWAVSGGFSRSAT